MQGSSIFGILTNLPTTTLAEMDLQDVLWESRWKVAELRNSF